MMAKEGRNTRGSLTTHLSIMVGIGRELIPSRLPTNRDLLRLGIFLREQAEKDSRNYTVSEIIRDIIPFLLKQWAKANEEFKAFS